MTARYRAEAWGEVLSSDVIRALERAHDRGMTWNQMADLCDMHKQTLGRAVCGEPISRGTRERIERFLERRRAA